MRKILCIMLFLVFISSAYGATVYKWVDKEGVVNFTDDLDKVPPSYRNRVEKEERKDVKEEVTPRPPQAATREDEPEEIKKDIHGRDETWWREKVGPWKERLKDATENLEKAQKKFADKTVEMGRKGLVSRARHQTEANKYDEEKKMYEAQIAEAEEMLEKLSKEAQESKADPAWLE